jgi:hypothetical protein
MTQIHAETVDRPGPKSRPDRFILVPLYIAGLLWLLIGSVMVYDPGNLFLPGFVLLALTILPFFALAWLVALIVAAVGRRWKIALSLVFSLIVFAGASAATLRFVDDIRFWTSSPYYLIKVASLPHVDGQPTKTRFILRGGLGWETWLDYDESDAEAPAPGELTRKWRDDEEMCDHTVRQMYRHFYLHQLSC